MISSYFSALESTTHVLEVSCCISTGLVFCPQARLLMNWFLGNLQVASVSWSGVVKGQIHFTPASLVHLIVLSLSPTSCTRVLIHLFIYLLRILHCPHVSRKRIRGWLARSHPHFFSTHCEYRPRPNLYLCNGHTARPRWLHDDIICTFFYLGSILVMKFGSLPIVEACIPTCDDSRTYVYVYCSQCLEVGTYEGYSWRSFGPCLRLYFGTI